MIATPEFAKRSSAAFTLLELSVVLIIIGLIVGGVLVGKDLVEAATIRSQITQIQQFQVATVTFKLKYAGLPGDLEQNKANQFGFTTFSCANGNDRLEDHTLCSGQKTYGQGGFSGEVLLFWNQLSTSGLISDKYVGTSTAPTIPSDGSLFNYVPKSRIAQLPIIAVNAMPYGDPTIANLLGRHFFNLVNIDSCSAGWGFWGSARPEWAALHPFVASQLDRKVDDGKPNTGTVQTMAVASGSQNSIQAIYAGSNSGRCVTAGGDYNVGMQPFDYFGTTLNQSCGLGFEF